MPAVVGQPVHEVAEDRLGLGTAAHALEQLSQLVRRLGPQGAGRGVVADRLLARDGALLRGPGERNSPRRRRDTCRRRGGAGPRPPRPRRVGQGLPSRTGRRRRPAGARRGGQRLERLGLGPAILGQQDLRSRSRYGSGSASRAASAACARPRRPARPAAHRRPSRRGTPPIDHRGLARRLSRRANSAGSSASRSSRPRERPRRRPRLSLEPSGVRRLGPDRRRARRRSRASRSASSSPAWISSRRAATAGLGAVALVGLARARPGPHASAPGSPGSRRACRAAPSSREDLADPRLAPGAAASDRSNVSPPPVDQRQQRRRQPQLKPPRPALGAAHARRPLRPVRASAARAISAARSRSCTPAR